jgi:hypothetical protein
MRILALTMLAAGTMLASAPARAQTYAPGFPVCLHVYGTLEGERIDCLYSTWDECRASASGRSAMCELNPYVPLVANAPAEPVRRKHRRHRQVQ